MRLDTTAETGRALILPGLVPLTRANVAAIIAEPDRHLELAADVCRFDPAALLGEDSSSMLSTVHEALLAVAALRRVEREREQSWMAFGGLSAGCIPALLLAGAISEETAFGLIHEINSRQISLKQAGAVRGMTICLLTASEQDVDPLLALLRRRGHEVWLSVDLGSGLVAVSTRTDVLGDVHQLFQRLGVVVLDVGDRPEHCPAAVPGRHEMTEILEHAPISTAQYVVISPVTGACVTGPDQIRSMMVEQWFAPASLTRLVDGLCHVDSVAAVDLVGPAESVYVNRTQALLTGRCSYEFLAIAG